MKKKLFVLLILLICISQNSAAYEYFTICFSDGTRSEAFYATDVDSICYSKIGLDSLEYVDWQVQEIYTCDSVYRYPLAQIDSLSFKDVDINQVAEDIAQVGNAVFPLVNQCASTDELSKHLSEITSLNGVDDAWTDCQTLFVKIKDFGTITYLFPPQDTPITDYTPLNVPFIHSVKRVVSEDVPDHDRQDAKRICIVNQQSKDETRGNKLYVATELEKYCSSLGMYVKYEPNPLPSFFENEIFNYDIVILMTHGHYEESRGLHWLATSDELCVVDKLKTINADVVADILISRGYYNNYSTRDIVYTCIPEVRNGDTCQVYYAEISNLFISKQKERVFRNYGNVIVFNTACQSLKGNENDAYNLAYAFGQKGARSYLGYDEVDQIGTGASLHFMLRLLNGQSTEQAFNTLPNKWKEETFEYPEKSGKSVSPKLGHVRSTNFGIISPKTLTEEYENNKVTIKGSMKILNPYGEEAKKNSYGLLYSKSRNMADCKVADCELDYDEQSHNVTFEYTFKDGELKAGSTYYYCAYMYDGYSNCYGQILSFKTAEPYYVWDSDTNTATFYYDRMRLSSHGVSWKEPYLPATDNQMKKIVFDSSFSNYYPKQIKFGGSNLLSIENLNYLNTDSITDMSYMFKGCSSLKSLDLSSFNTSNVTIMSHMFEGCSSLTSLDLSSFNTSNVTDMRLMFFRCSSLKSLDLSSFNTSNGMMDIMFMGCSSLKTLCWNFLNIKGPHSQWLEACNSLESITIKKLKLSSYWGRELFIGLNALKSIVIDSADTKDATSMSSMFSGCSSLTSLDLSSFNTSNVTDMGFMFFGCSSLKSLDLSSFNTSNVTNMHRMCVGCSSLESLNLSNFNTSNVTDMGFMFRNCSSLKSLDLSSFNTSNVTIMYSMFFRCSSLESLNLSNFNTSNVTDMEEMFTGCFSLTSLDVSSFKTANVKYMGSMFSGCSSLTSLDLSNFDISNTVTNHMFYGCTSLQTIYAKNWNTYGYGLFIGCDNLVGGKGTKIGENIYGYDKNGNPRYYFCSDDGRAAHIDGGKDNPGLFTEK